MLVSIGRFVAIVIGAFQLVSNLFKHDNVSRNLAIGIIILSSQAVIYYFYRILYSMCLISAHKKK